jgi:diguanylate cyclase (GGDEF)-like protein/PAS domain S-box-containing protein
MTAQTATIPAFAEDTGTPVEMLVVGCPLAVADTFANALRNQGQAAHVKLAEGLGTLEQQLASDRCRVALVNADSDTTPYLEAIAKIRANNPLASIIVIASEPADHRDKVIENNIQDLVKIKHHDHVALAVRREHQSQQLRSEVKQLRRQLDEAEDRSNQLVQSSRDAIAYIHEGMYLNTNKAYLDLFGYRDADELDGLPIMDMIDAESRTAFKRALRAVDEEGKHSAEFTCVTEEGQSFAARMEFLPASIDGEHCTQVVIRDQSQNLALQKRIEELTSRDVQTGFFNRQAFMERLDAVVSHDASSEQGHSLVQLSITNYRDLRDSCGFDCVEQMLTEVANVLTATVTKAHTLARFGDHDFMILCNDDEPALEIAERCLHNLRGHAFMSVNDSPVKPLYAIGVTRAEQDSELTAHELINRSCRATGIARTEGDNRVVFYNDHIPGDTSHLPEADAAVVKQIDQALGSDGFRLKYQPIVSLQGDTRENYSVYLRMIGEDGAEVVPEIFLSPANDSKRLAEIDRWVVRNAIRELASHRKAGKKIVFYIILSRASIEDESMLLWICDCLREFRAKGSWLVFQFRESDLRAALAPAKHLIDGLRKVNCRIALNNFAGPDAEDALFRHLEIDVVKLSPEFMRQLAGNPEQQAAMNRANARLQEAGYKTIASNVEDAGSLAILWNVGVNYIQGYFLQEPSSAIVFDEDQAAEAP